MSSPRPGDRGATVRDLHRRLDDAGHAVDADEVGAGEFGPDTERAVLAFQTARGLDQHGAVDAATHSALVEAGFRLGDRHLYLHSPMFRGDDVANLQLRLGSLGFDAGRIDGIFGPDTTTALAEFQRNVGLAVDGIAGPDTVRQLRQLASQSTGLRPVAQVRELDRLRSGSPDLHEQRIAIGHFGGAAALTAALGRILRTGGGQVVELDHPDEANQAFTANEFSASLYLGLRIENYSHHQVAYFATEGFHSEGGLRLAHRCAEALDRIPVTYGSTGDMPDAESPEPQTTTCQGRRLDVLRRTRMPAVLCNLAPASTVVLATAEIANALAKAISQWIADPTADPSVVDGPADLP